MYTLQNPPTENQDAGQFDLHWAIPAISPSERYFLSQLISSPSKEVKLNKGYFASLKRIILDKNNYKAKKCLRNKSLKAKLIKLFVLNPLQN